MRPTKLDVTPKPCWKVTAHVNGEVVLVKATPKDWQKVSRFTIPEKTKIARKQGKIWTPPVIANGRLYLRDNDLIFCYDIKRN